MVKGLDTFRRYFEGDTDKYVLIGGAACDINFTNYEASFRATRDLDSEYKKHKKDILKIVVEHEVNKPKELPQAVLEDITYFINSLSEEPFDVNTLINYGVTTDDVAERLRGLFL